MLTTTFHQTTHTSARDDYAAFTPAQKIRLGDILVLAHRLQHIGQVQLIEVWAEQGLTAGLHNTLGAQYLRSRQRWEVVLSTADHLQLDLSHTLRLACTNAPVTAAHVARLCVNPLRQLTMLTNGFRAIIRPWLRRLRMQYPTEVRQRVIQRWITLEYIPHLQAGHQCFVPTSHKLWSIDMMHIFHNTLKLNLPEASAHAFALIENAKPPS